MADILNSVRAALGPLIEAGTVSGVSFVGAASLDGGLKPIVSVTVAGPRPEESAAEISRLLAEAGLDVEWTIAARDGPA